MSGNVTLLMAVHCHQPVGNFGFVFEAAYVKAYEPFLRVLERHPGVRLTLHYSGPLLDWLTENHPEFLERVQALVRRGQVELLASGYYEPILPIIPDRDRQGQIAQMREMLRARCGAQAGGLWLTERVWEPELPETLAHAGIRYTIVDTNQFLLAKPWLPSAMQFQDDSFWDLLGYYTTEYAGETIVLFPASKRLRYWMPFRQVEETIQFLRRLQRVEPIAITFADDGEKFGFWPETYRWVYDEGWLDQFFSALEREQGWLATSTFQEYLEHATPSGRAYLPCGSYEEMLEWSGGQFRNFFMKYPEARAMEQKMLTVSRAIAELKAEKPKGHGKRSRVQHPDAQAAERDRLLQQAQRELYAGQCNCAYWHGVFGGLYLSHLRRAVYTHLIAAEELANQAGGCNESIAVVDADGDGAEEVSLRNRIMGVLVDPDEGGALTEWNLYRAKVNLLDTLTRRPEPYHEKLRAKQVNTAVTASTPVSIHDVLGAKEDNLVAHLIYDDHRRSSFLDYGLQGIPTLQEVVRSSWAERRLWSPGVYQREDAGLKDSSASKFTPLGVVLTRRLQAGMVRKTVRLVEQQQVLECSYEMTGIDVPVVAIEFNLSLRDNRYLTTPGRHNGSSQFSVAESGAGVSLALSIDPPATIMHFPIETVSESEEGLERTYQGLCVLCFWGLGSPGSWSGRLHWTVEAP